jgi:hypothetical protein
MKNNGKNILPSQAGIAEVWLIFIPRSNRVMMYKTSLDCYMKTNYSGTTPYSLRASASLHMEEYTCNSKGGKPPETPDAPYRAARIKDEVALGGTGI